MAVKTPLEIGTKGTIGSLIRQELEYFSRIKLGCQDTPQKPRCQFTDTTAATSSYSKPKYDSLITTPKQKKRGGNKLIPSMCSMVEVAESNRPNGTYGYCYRNLKAEMKNMQA